MAGELPQGGCRYHFVQKQGFRTPVKTTCQPIVVLGSHKVPCRKTQETKDGRKLPADIITTPYALAIRTSKAGVLLGLDSILDCRILN